MNRVRELTGAAFAYEKGFYGDGVGVALLDSGVNDRHPDLTGRVVYSYNYLTASKEAPDDCGHGTHICGIIGGTGVASAGRYQGLAPRCHFLSMKVLDQKGNGDSSSVIKALHWLMDHGKEYNVRLVNISVGSTGGEKETRSELLRAVEEAWDAGLVICAAAGNQGPNRASVTAPGTSPRVITVGSSDDSRAVRVLGVRRIHYSGRGPTAACVCKPEVVAPGAYLNSCNADFSQHGKGMYVAKSGTSMATPVVTGSLALLLSRDRSLTNKELKLRLRGCCRDLGFERNQHGWGQIWVPGLFGA